MNKTIDELKQVLSESHVSIEFTKADGSKRNMICTKRSADIPVDQTPKGVARKTVSNNIIVFDLEKNAWRSIKPDSINNWQINKSFAT
jgi:hypothetical protein